MIKDKPQSTQPTIHIRQEVFDHLVYPLSVKLDDNIIIQLFRKLHIMSSIDYKISLEDWIQQSTTFLQGFTEKEAVILFNTYKIISPEFESVNPMQNKKIESKNTVDVRYFGLYFALQCYIQKNKGGSVDTLDKNAYGSNPNSSLNYSMSPMSSPRGKQNSLRNSSSNLLNEAVNMVNFVKNNIKLFLRLIATDIHNSETQLNSGEFNTLKFFFRFNESLSKTTGKQGGINQMNLLKSGLAGIAPFYLNFSSTTKVNIEKITEWVYSNLNSNSQEADENTIVLKNLSKCLTVKEDLTGKSVKILNCEDSQIFIDSAIGNIKISNCTNCIIYAAAVSKFTTIEKCEACTITICSNFLKIGNCIECRINSFSNQEPVLYGDNKSLVLGPHNVYYPELVNMTKNYARSTKSNPENLISFSSPTLMHQNLSTSTSNYKTSYEVLNPKDFVQMITPFNKNQPSTISSNTFELTPPEYLNTLILREELFMKTQSLIKSAGLEENQEKVLHEAIQGHFREWLISSGKIKLLTDIVKMMDISEIN